MKMGKRILSLLLALVMIVTMLPLESLATETKTETSVDTGDLTMEGTNGFGTLLSQEIEENQEESAEAEGNYEPGYSIVDLTFAGAEATVEYHSLEEATLMVGVYSEDGMKMLASGEILVSPEEEIITVTIEGDMPEYFQASAYLIDTYDMSPLCAAYDTPMYTQEMQELLESTIDDYDPDRVLNLDEDETTNFAVYAETTKIIEYVEGYNTVVSVDEETGTYVIQNADEQFTTLRVRDVFVYGYGEYEMLIAKVADITVDGTTVTIVGDELDLTEVFEKIKIEAQGEQGDLTIDDSTASEGLVYQNAPETAMFASVRSRESDSGDVSCSIGVSFNAIKLGGDAVNAKLSGGATIGISFGIEYYVTTSYQRIELSSEVSLTGTVAITGTAKGTIKLGKFNFDIIPSVLRLGTNLNFVAKVEGKVEASLTVGMEMSTIIDHGKQGWNFKSDCDPELEVETKFEGSVFFGLELEPNAKILYGVLADITLIIDGGVECSLEKELHPKKTNDEIHLCDKCFSGEMRWLVTVEGSAKFLKMKKLSIKMKILELSSKIDDIYYTVGMPYFGFGQCPNLSYKLTVNVVDTNDRPVKDAEVTVGGNNVTTNNKGIAEVFLPVAEYKVTVEKGDLRKKHNVYMDSAQKIKITLSPDGGSKNFFGSILPDEYIDDTFVYDSGQCGENVFWELDNHGRLLISGNGPMWNFMESGAPWYSERASITSVIIEKGVTTIGDYAFYYCASLNNTKIANSVTTIGASAFETCSSLSSLEIPNSVTTIGEYAFYACNGLYNVEIPNSVTTICRAAFGNCDGLNRVEIPNSVTTVDDYTFAYCDSLASVMIPNGVTTIGHNAFQSCTSLKSVTIPNSMLTIKSGAFSYCTSLKSVTMGYSVTKIGGNAFYYCTSLMDIVFQGNAPDFESGVFTRVTAIAYYPDGNATWTSDVMQNFGGTITWKPYPMNKSGQIILNEASTISSETSIAPYAFYDGDYSGEIIDSYIVKKASFSGLVPGQQYVLLAMVSMEVEDPLSADNLLYIDQAVALEDGTLVFRYVQKTPTEISYVVACGASNKDLNDAEITFPEMIPDGELQIVNPTVVYDGKTLVEGQDYTILGNVSFTESGIYTCYIRGVRNYTGLVECTYTVGCIASGSCGSDLTWALYDDGVLSILGTGAMTNWEELRDVPWYQNREQISKVVISEGVTNIGNYAFAGCNDLITIEIPTGVTTIGTLAFGNCFSLNEIEIPEGVKSIGERAFSTCSKLNTIHIPASATDIRNGAFYNCSSLNSIALPEGIRSISDELFYNCSSLTSLEIPESVTSIGWGAFHDCSSLTMIELPAGLTRLSNCAFSGCSKLKRVNIPKGITRLGSQMFYGCSSLTTLEIPKSVTCLEREIFYGCTNLTTINIPEEVTTIEVDAFFGCPNLTIHCYPKSIGYSYAVQNKIPYVLLEKIEGQGECGDNLTWTLYTTGELRISGTGNMSDFATDSSVPWAQNSYYVETVVIEDGVTSIGNYAFYWCQNLSEIEIPEGVTFIGKEAFVKCYELIKMALPKSLNYVAEDAFADCSGLSELHIKDLDDWCGIHFESMKSNPLFYAEELYVNEVLLTNDIKIPEGVTKIGDYAFAMVDFMSSLTIPESVSEIGKEAFGECANLEKIYFNATNMKDFDEKADVFSYSGFAGNGISIVIGQNVKKIPAYLCFSNNYYTVPNVSSIVFADGSVCESIGEYAFSGCEGLDSITIPKSVIEIKKGAFSVCKNLASVIWETESKCQIIGESVFASCASLTNITIPNMVVSMGNRVFSKCYNLESIKIPSRVKCISDYMFYDCNKLERVILEENSVCESIGDYSFSGCDLLGEFKIPQGVMSIGDYAFEVCDGLTSVAIPVSVEVIGEYAFSDCDNLESVYITDLEAWCAIDFVTSSSNPLYNEGDLYVNDVLVTEVEFPKGTTVIKDYVFVYYENLQKAIIPDSVTNIGNGAFNGCSNLQDVNFSNNLRTIGERAFCGCESLTNLIIPESIEIIGKYAFYDCYLIKNIEFNAISMNDLTEFNYVFGYIGYGGNGTKVTIGEKVTRIPAFLFCPYGIYNSAPNVTNIIFEKESVCEEIGEHAFSLLSNLEEVTLSNHIRNIGKSAFRGCRNLKKIVIPKSVELMEESVFMSCNGMEEITFEGNAPMFADNVFDSITASAYYPENNNTWATEVQQNYGGTIVWVSYDPREQRGNCGENITWKLDSKGVLEIFGSGDMYDWTSASMVPWNSYKEQISSVIFLNELKNDQDVLGENQELEGIEHIGNYAFDGCSNLSEIELPESLVSIGISAFGDCSSLTTLEISQGVNTIGDGAFINCRDIVVQCYENSYAYTYVVENIIPYVLIDEKGTCGENLTWKMLNNGVLIISGTGNMDNYQSNNVPWKEYRNDITSVVINEGVTSSGTYAFYGCSNLSEIELPEGLTSIGTYGFYMCSGLRSIELPEGLTSIASDTFSGCSGLREIELPEGLISIGRYAFRYCSSLSEIKLPEGLTSIGKYAFGGCSSLSLIELPEGITRIEEGVFCDCRSLREIELPEVIISIAAFAFDNCSSLYEIELPEGITQIEKSVFSNCSSLREIKLPKGLTEIGERVFYGCSNLSSIELSEGLTSISSYAFGQCRSLREIELPEGIRNIDAYAFEHCNGLIRIVIPKSVTSISANAFYRCNNLVISCYQDSVAHTYAEGKKIPYVLLDEPVLMIPVTDVFSDVKIGKWYIDAVQYVYDNGLMSGNNGLFNPTGNITRAQVVTTIYNMEGRPAVTNYKAVNDLVDVQAGQWYTDAVCWAYNVGVAAGNSVTKMFNMNSAVTRQQLATFFYNYAVYKGLDTTTRGDYSGLLGADQVASYAADTMKWAYGTGLITGSKIENGSGATVYDLKPTGTATRAQVSSILQRFCENNGIK